ncbi:hypothetical protein G6F52_012674 [Rhizopus delemar]|nr:hypothetical protein G6F52_012674 [Rhizopus delemar]
MYWGAAKREAHLKCDYSFKSLEENIDSFLDKAGDLAHILDVLMADKLFKSVHDVDKKYYADGEDALAMRLTLKETKPVTRKIVEEVNTVAAH